MSAEKGNNCDKTRPAGGGGVGAGGGGGREGLLVACVLLWERSVVKECSYTLHRKCQLVRQAEGDGNVVK